MKTNLIKQLTEKINVGYVIKINIFNMDYIITKENEKFIIYSLSDKDRKKYYNSLDTLFKKFKIYNESLKENQDKIKVVSEELNYDYK